jgi:N-acetylglucosaminyl-diphospho-decaprenol L-rhamnosyltransferase
MAEVAVAVVSWNTRELLRSCLASLAPEVGSGRAAAWVVDNGSDDGSPDLVREEFPWAELIASADNLGFGAAVNLVAERSTTAWIAASNADVQLGPGALEAMLAAGRSHPEAGSIAPRLVSPDGHTQHSVHRFPSTGLALAFNSRLHRIVPGLGDRLCFEGHWDPDRERVVDWAHGAFLLVRRQAFDEAGGFDPGQWMYAEDLDLAWRLHREGWSTRYLPRARVHHAVGAAAKQAFGDDRTARHTAAAYAWLRRRRGAGAARAYAAVNVAGSALRLGLLAPLARLDPERYARSRARERRYLTAHRRQLQGGGGR